MGIKVLQMTTLAKAQEFAEKARIFSELHKGVDTISEDVFEKDGVFYVRFDDEMDLEPWRADYMDPILDKKPPEQVLHDSVERTMLLEEVGREFVTSMIGEMRAKDGTPGSGLSTPEGLALFKLLGWTRACLKQGMFPEAYLEFRQTCEPAMIQMGEQVIVEKVKAGMKGVAVKLGIPIEEFTETDAYIAAQGV